MASHVNLDALISREDFDITDPTHEPGQSKSTVSVTDLRSGDFLFASLRKPDFQRETSQWGSSKIVDFVESFLTGDLIPAVILWRNPNGYTFVIDGSHRLSALAAWINDDYGDGQISKQFYESAIPDEQNDIAAKTRVEMNKKLGPYLDYHLAISSPEKVKPEVVERSRRLGTLAIDLQYVVGDAAKAETSFFKINQLASPIDRTELKVLKLRRTPIGIAARAIARSGKGHKYWATFNQDNIASLETLASEIHTLLFKPLLPKSPLKTLDIPVAGPSYAAQSLPLIVDFIELVNVARATDIHETDDDGAKTIACLRQCKRIAQLIDSNDPGSLGLHPAVYFYAPNGRHKVASFIAIVALMLEFGKSDLIRFTRVRGKFEMVLIPYDYLVQQIVRSRRGATASLLAIKDFYQTCISSLDAGKSMEEIIADAVSSRKFGKLIPEQEEPLRGVDSDPAFSRAVKTNAFLRTALENANRCSICDGYLHVNAISIDHKVRQQDGGRGGSDNAQLTHPFCNTGYKEKMNAKG